MNKAARIIALLFLPLLLPIRGLVKLSRYSYHGVMKHIYLKRVKKAREKAISLNSKYHRRFYGIKNNYRVDVYDTTEVKRLNKNVEKYAKKTIGPVKIEYRALTIFKIEPDGTIIDC